MKSIWTANYDNNEIKIENTWFHGERLFVNGKIQDEKQSMFSSDLTGHIITRNGEKALIKAHIGGYFKIVCRLFVDDEKVELIQEK